VDSDDVLRAVQTKAREMGGLPAPASEDDLHRAEAHLGFSLHPLHARVLLEVADGGLLPWMYGISSHGERDQNRGVVEMREHLGGKDGCDLPAFYGPTCRPGVRGMVVGGNADRKGARTGRVRDRRDRAHSGALARRLGGRA